MEFVRIHEIKLNAKEAKGLSAQELEQLLLKRTGRRLRLPAGSLRKIRIAKESLDAREKPDVYRVFSVDVLDSEFEPQELLAEARRSRAKAAVVTEEPVAFPEKRALPEGAKRPVVAGFGPCGIFAALTLAEAGLREEILRLRLWLRLRMTKGNVAETRFPLIFLSFQTALDMINCPVDVPADGHDPERRDPI